MISEGCEATVWVDCICLNFCSEPLACKKSEWIFTRFKGLQYHASGVNMHYMATLTTYIESTNQNWPNTLKILSII